MTKLQQLWIENESHREILENALTEAANEWGEHAWFDNDGSPRMNDHIEWNSPDIKNDVIVRAIELYEEEAPFYA